MKVDLRDSMLEKNPKKEQKKSKKTNWKKIFSILIGDEKIEKSSSVELLNKKTNSLKKNKAYQKFKENNFPKVKSIGIGQADFQSTKNENDNKDFPENSIQSDYQEEPDLDYLDNYYVKNYPEKILIKWQGPDHIKISKSKNWYIVMGLILSTIVIYAIYMQSPLMAITFILIGIVGYIYLERKPLITDFAITYDGIIAGNEIYDYDDINSFWIFYEPPHTKIISLSIKGKIVPYIHIPLHQVDPVEVREKMMKFIPEIKQEKNLVDVLERLLQM